MEGKAKYSTLSNKKIKEYLQEERIVIEPYNERQLGMNSYDVTLGEYYYKESYTPYKEEYYNIYSEKEVERVWGEKAERALTRKEYNRKNCAYLDQELENISEKDKLIIIGPGETILAHTQEYIGGRGSVTTKMYSRSSLGRNFIEVCKCSGLGDCGYINRWTMEITNNSKYRHIILVVGRRIAQIVFMETDGVIDKTYEEKGKYQKEKELKKLKEKWEPKDMLPKMYLDYEVKELKKN